MRIVKNLGKLCRWVLGWMGNLPCFVTLLLVFHNSTGRLSECRQAHHLTLPVTSPGTWRLKHSLYTTTLMTGIWQRRLYHATGNKMMGPGHSGFYLKSGYDIKEIILLVFSLQYTSKLVTLGKCIILNLQCSLKSRNYWLSFSYLL